MYELLTHWWFWLSLPIAILVLGRIERGLSKYSRSYWRGRGKEQPAPSTSYLNAGRFLLYAGVAGVGGLVLLVDREWLWGALLAAVAVVFGWIALDRARRNII